MGLLEGGAMASSINQNERFKDGDFEVKDLNKAIVMAENIHALSSFAPEEKLHKNRAFSRACVDMFKNKKYNQSTMVTKLKYLSSRLRRCPSSEEYLRMFEDIYNYRTREEKVRFI